MNQYPTSIGTSDESSITVLGQDLATQLLGKVGFVELAFWFVALRKPTANELRVFESILVALADHGFTPTALAARLALTGAPESVQGALAAGLLGGGSRFLGVTEDTGRMLHDALQQCRETNETLPSDELGWDGLAVQTVSATSEHQARIPGLGHTLHKHGDPRTPVLMQIARDEALFGPHLQLLEAIGRTHSRVLSRSLPLNGAGVCGAMLCDLGFEPEILRGFALLARTAGLLGHIAEEQRNPIGITLYADVEQATTYVPPGGSAG